MAWTDLIGLADLEAKGKAVVRHEGRQILLITSERGLYACANRCPHEGYPLSEGVLTDGCVLTCNWHNWKFDLDKGETLVGGDRLRRFPVKAEGGRVLVDLAPEDPVERKARVLGGLRQALEDEDQDRLVREAARLALLDGDAVEAVVVSVGWSAERLEFGTQHGFAAAADWLALHDRASINADRKLTAIGEILGHIAEDGHGGERFAFAPGVRVWDPAAYLDAVEREDEAKAVARVRGALAAGLETQALLPTLARAALRHYADFGHSLIYAVKSLVLAERLGPASTEPLLLNLTRNLVYMTREDLLPEFRDYAARLAEWGTLGASAPALEIGAVTGRSAKQAMAIVGAWSARHPAPAIYDVLVEAAAWMMLHVDEPAFLRTDGKIADNINWLDFTHALTFAEAGGAAVKSAPDLWPALLLQMACFVGRNGAFVDADQDVAAFTVADPKAFLAEATERLFDHGRERFILSAHILKTTMAGAALATAVPPAAATIYAALNRFLLAPIKRRHTLRTARQMRAFVAQE